MSNVSNDTEKLFVAVSAINELIIEEITFRLIQLSIVVVFHFLKFVMVSRGTATEPFSQLSYDDTGAF